MGLNFSARFSGSNTLNVANYTGNPAAFSVSHWVNLTANQTVRTMFANYQPTGSKGWVTGISDTLTNKVKFYFGGGTLTSATALTVATWAHVVCTWDGTTFKIYLNGNTTPDASVAAVVTYGTAATNNYFGSADGSIQKLNGRLAGVGYWSKAVSTTEVTSLYNSGAGLAGSDLSGTLLTGLVSYHDFLDSANLGTDSSGNSHTYSNTGTVTQDYGPNPPFPTYQGRGQRPRLPVMQGRWRSGLARAQVFPSQASASFIDPASFSSYTSSGSVAWGTNAYGPCLTPNDSTGQGCWNLGTPIAHGATEFTLAALALTNTAVGGGAGLRHLWGEETTTANMRLALSGGLLSFQVGADGAFTNLTVDPPPLNVPVVITCRLTTAGVRSIWYGAVKVAERTDSGCAWGSGTGSLGLGSAVTSTTRNWSGQINGGHVWNQALDDTVVIFLANNFFAPVQPLHSSFAPLLAFAAMISGPRKLAGPGGLAGPYAHLAGNM